jgi:hypothetical protein
MELNEAQEILNNNGYICEAKTSIEAKIKRELKKLDWTDKYDFIVKETPDEITVYANADYEYIEDQGDLEETEFEFVWDKKRKDCYFKIGNANFGKNKDDYYKTLDDFLVFIDETLERNHVF